MVRNGEPRRRPRDAPVGSVGSLDYSPRALLDVRGTASTSRNLLPVKRSEILSSRQLAHFVAIVEAGSLGRAATALRLTEPALSKSIRSLERLLDVKLFDRGPRGFDLTPFGESLLDHARVILTEFRRTHADIAELRGAEAGRVYVGTGPTFASTLVPRAVMALLAKRPAVRVTIYEGYGDTLVPMTLRGELDFFVT